MAFRERSDGSASQLNEGTINVRVGTRICDGKGRISPLKSISLRLNRGLLRGLTGKSQTEKGQKVWIISKQGHGPVNIALSNDYQAYQSKTGTICLKVRLIRGESTRKRMGKACSNICWQGGCIQSKSPECKARVKRFLEASLDRKIKSREAPRLRLATWGWGPSSGSLSW